MIDILQSILAFIVALGVLITFHEFGHFWVARLCNVKVLRFSVGFGRMVWKRNFGVDQSEFGIGAIPLGGYVKMLDEREGAVVASETDRAFNNKSLGQRFAIVIAGPVFNFIFAIFTYWVIYMVGVNGLKPVIGEIEPGSIAAQAGMQAGDKIIKIDGKPTPTWLTVLDVLVAKVVEEEEIQFTLRSPDAGERLAIVDLSRISIDEMAGGQLLRSLGLSPQRPIIPAIIGEVVAGGAAERAGMQMGDKVLAVDGVSVSDWIAWVEVIRESPGKPLNVELLRGEEYLQLVVIPEKVTLEDQVIGRIGAIVDGAYRVDNNLLAIESYSVFGSFIKGLDKTYEMSIMTLRILGKMIVGKVSVKNLSGPISIAKYAGDSAQIGFIAFLSFLAIVSISLGVLNLLPIPLLDGGHLFYYIIEFFKGSPVSESVQIIGQQVGLAILLGLMGLAFYNDILRYVS